MIFPARDETTDAACTKCEGECQCKKDGACTKCEGECKCTKAADCVCAKGKAGDPVWCAKCDKGYVDGEPADCPNCVKKAQDALKTEGQ